MTDTLEYNPLLERPAREGYPVNAVTLDGKVVDSFISCAEAARAYGCDKSTLRAAVERGWRCGGVWWRYADMPAECQPLVPPRGRNPRTAKGQWRKPIKYAGVSYPSVRAAALALGIHPNTLWKRIKQQTTPPPVRMWELDPNYPATW